MAVLTQEQFRTTLTGVLKQDPSVDPNEVLRRIVSQGHSIEGIDPESIQRRLQPSTQVLQPTGIDSLKQPTSTDQPGFQFSEMVKNIGPSGKRLYGDIASVVKDVATNIRHPSESTTVQALSSLASGLVEKLVPGRQRDEQSVDQFTDFLKDRYGSVDNVLNTIEKDPAGFTADMSVVLGGVGAGLKLTGVAAKSAKLAKVASVSTKAGTVASKVGSIIDPVTAPLKLGSAALKTKALRFAPFSESVDREVLNIAKQRGIDLPTSAASKSPVPALLEVGASKSLFGAKIGRKFDTAFNQILDFSDDIIKKTKGIDDPKLIGNQILSGLNDARSKFSDLMSQVYDNVDPNRMKLIQGTADDTIKLLKSYIERAQASKVAGGGRNLGRLKGILSNLEGKIKPSKEFFGLRERARPNAYQLKEFLKELNTQFKDPKNVISVGGDKQAAAMRSTLRDDINRIIKAKDPVLGEALSKADLAFRENITKLNSSLNKAVLRLKDAPERIVDLYSSKVVGEDMLRQSLNGLDEPTRNGVKASTLKKIIEKATSKDNNRITPAGIETAMYKIGHDKLKLLVGDEAYTALSDLDKLSKAMGRISKISSNSPTSFFQRLALPMAIGLIKSFDPTIIVQYLIADAAFTKAISSKAGRAMMLEGLEFPANFSKNIDKLIPGLSAAGKAAITGERVQESKEPDYAKRY